MYICILLIWLSVWKSSTVIAIWNHVYFRYMPAHCILCKLKIYVMMKDGHIFHIKSYTLIDNKESSEKYWFITELKFRTYIGGIIQYITDITKLWALESCIKCTNLEKCNNAAKVSENNTGIWQKDWVENYIYSIPSNIFHQTAFENQSVIEKRIAQPRNVKVWKRDFLKMPGSNLQAEWRRTKRKNWE